MKAREIMILYDLEGDETIEQCQTQLIGDMQKHCRIHHLIAGNFSVSHQGKEVFSVFIRDDEVSEGLTELFSNLRKQTIANKN